jgi:hypothetical protein
MRTTRNHGWRAYVKAVFWGAVAGLTLIGTTPASAIDLNGRIIVIDGVWHPWGDGQPMASKVTIRGVGGLVQWSSGVSEICEIKGRGIEMSLVYGPQASRTDQLACDPTRSGTASRNETRNGSGSFTTSYANNGDTLTLSGQMNFRNVTVMTQSGPAAEVQTFTNVYQVRRAISLRFTGNKCEVLNFAADGSQQRTIHTVAGPGRDPVLPLTNRSFTENERWVVPDRTKCAVMPIGDYTPQLSGARR